MIASGDLTHRGRADEHDAAAAFLRSGSARRCSSSRGTTTSRCSRPRRFTQPWREFERNWETTQPVFASPALHVVGLNSVRPLAAPVRRDQATHSSNRAERSARRGAGGAARRGLHHQLVGAAVADAEAAAVARRTHVLERLADAGAELIVGGHVHQGTDCRAARVRGADRDARACVVATAPGLGRPRVRTAAARRAACSYIARTPAHQRRDLHLGPQRVDADGDAHVPARLGTGPRARVAARLESRHHQQRWSR